jgi:hypothetical protein
MMKAEKSSVLSRLMRLRERLHRQNRKAALMLEFAFVGPVFFVFLLVIFEVAYNQYLKSVLDTALQATARQMQLGELQSFTTEPTLVAGQVTPTREGLCPNALGLLGCSNLFIRIERLDTTTCPGGAGAADFYDDTNGQLPVSGGQLLLSLYGGSGATPVPNGVGPGHCDLPSSSSGFCTPGPSSSTPEFIILSAIYVAPSFLGGLVGESYKYTFPNGSTRYVRAISSDAAFITEGFTQTATPANPC